LSHLTVKFDSTVTSFPSPRRSEVRTLLSVTTSPSFTPESWGPILFSTLVLIAQRCKAASYTSKTHGSPVLSLDWRIATVLSLPKAYLNGVKELNIVLSRKPPVARIVMSPREKLFLHNVAEVGTEVFDSSLVYR
jgi:hypothetical protein